MINDSFFLPMIKAIRQLNFDSKYLSDFSNAIRVKLISKLNEFWLTSNIIHQMKRHDILK